MAAYGLFYVLAVASLLCWCRTRTGRAASCQACGAVGVDAYTLAYARGGADLCHGMTAIAAPLNRLRAGVFSIAEWPVLWTHGVVPWLSVYRTIKRLTAPLTPPVVCLNGCGGDDVSMGILWAIWARHWFGFHVNDKLGVIGWRWVTE